MESRNTPSYPPVELMLSKAPSIFSLMCDGGGAFHLIGISVRGDLVGMEVRKYCSVAKFMMIHGFMGLKEQ